MDALRSTSTANACLNIGKVLFSPKALLAPASRSFQKKQPFRFLDLPPEVRIMIYKLILPGSAHHRCAPASETTRHRLGHRGGCCYVLPRHSLAILRVSQQIHTESGAVLYKHALFSVHITLADESDYIRIFDWLAGKRGFVPHMTSILTIDTGEARILFDTGDKPMRNRIFPYGRFRCCRTWGIRSWHSASHYRKHFFLRDIPRYPDFWTPHGQTVSGSNKQISAKILKIIVAFTGLQGGNVGLAVLSENLGPPVLEPCQRVLDMRAYIASRVRAPRFLAQDFVR